MLSLVRNVPSPTAGQNDTFPLTLFLSGCQSKSDEPEMFFFPVTRVTLLSQAGYGRWTCKCTLRIQNYVADTSTHTHTHTLKFRVCLACLPSPPPPPPSPSHSWPLSSGSPIIPRSPGSASAVNGFPRAPLALFRQFRQVFCAPIEPHYKLFIL